MTTTPGRVERHWAVVTGAAGGIGQAMVATFADAGYSVIATDVAPQPRGLDCTEYLQVDLALTVTDEAYAEDVFSRIRAMLGTDGLHVLINNAAVQILGGVDSLSRTDWASTLNVNLLAPFLWTQALIGPLEAARGCVVNVSSVHARLTKRGFVAYATSKAALSGMTRAMAVDVGGRVRVNAIEPAAVDTCMLRAGFAGHLEALTRLAACHPIGRMARPEEIAQLARSIADGGFSFAHGACLSLDGAISSVLHDPL
jgi:NAD(P)-dependent dehydrogenase (short-subunit alcohol dehydrogenase family)